MAAPNPGRDFAAAAKKGLSTPKDLIGWTQFGNSWQATIPVIGTASGNECRIVIIASTSPPPSGNISVLWDNERVEGLDLDGPRHPNRQGQRIPTPHRQFIDQHGKEDTVAVDLSNEGIKGLETGARWLAKQAGIQWNSLWQDPPLQGSMVRKTPPPKQRKSSRRTRK
jgi:hypothetical protein